MNLKLTKISPATLLLGLALMVPHEASADWLKDLGKAIEVIGGSNKSSTNKTKQSSSSQTKQSNTSQTKQTPVYGPISGLQMKVLSCQRWGYGVKVTYSVTNTTSYDRKLFFTHLGDCCDSTKPDPTMIDDHNQAYEGGPMTLGQDEFVPQLGYLTANVPAGLTLKGIYVIKSVAPDARSFSKLTIAGNDISAGRQKEWIPFEYTFTNVPITEVSNTSGSNVVCTLPTLYVDYKEIRRDGRNVILSFTLRNDSNSDLSIWQLRSGASDMAYSTDGDGFDLKWQIGADGASSIPTGIPVKCTVTIKNVPASVTSFSLIRLGMNNNQYKIEFKNLSI